MDQQYVMNANAIAQNTDIRRLKAFAVTELDLAHMRAQADFARRDLPRILEAGHAHFSDWPEIAKALASPQVHEARLAHWVRLVSGQLGDGFIASARRLAQAFYDNGVPGYAVAICHSTVINTIIRELGLNGQNSSLSALLNPAATQQRNALRDTLQRLAWYDLELLLETYAEAEQASRVRALTAMADTVEREAGDAVAQVAQRTDHMAREAEDMASAAGRVGENARNVTNSAERALENAQTVASATTQLVGAIQEIASQVNHSGRLTRKAVETGTRTEATIDSLTEAVSRIGEVAQMIADIAAQTNLLALNATIEAARAGEAGKGFAVVANEVKALANQTARSTEEISRHIIAIQQVTTAAVSAVSDMGATIHEIDSVSSAIAAAIEEQSAATQEISRNVAATSEAVSDVAQRIAQVSGEVSHTGQQAAQVKSGSGAVATSVEELRRVLVDVVRSAANAQANTGKDQVA